MLSVLIWLPIFAAIFIAILPASIPKDRIRLIALVVSGIVLFWNLFILLKFDISNPGMQFKEYLPWNETLGLSYQIGVDGLSILMLVLNSLLTWISVYSSSKETERPRLFYSMILLVSGGVAGAFFGREFTTILPVLRIRINPLLLTNFHLGRGKTGLCWN